MGEFIRIESQYAEGGYYSPYGSNHQIVVLHAKLSHTDSVPNIWDHLDNRDIGFELREDGQSRFPIRQS
jgi:hypothetical protein